MNENTYLISIKIMAKDYTKYEVKGMEAVFTKGKLVLAIVSDYCSKNECTFEELKQVFPDGIQGSSGIFDTLDKAKEIAKKRARHFVNDAIKIKDGTIAVSSQWGDNISNFIEVAESLSYKVSSKKNESNSSKEDQGIFDISLTTNLDDINRIVEKLVYSENNIQEIFNKNVIQFINDNNESYWLLLAINDSVLSWQNKIDDEGLDLSVDELNLSGRKLNFNPYEKYRLFFNWREEKFGIEEDDDPTSFFAAIMDSFYDFNSYTDLLSLSDDEFTVFQNLSTTALLCTVCKECENNIDLEDLVNLLLNINFDELQELKDKSNIVFGDIAVEILEDVLKSLGVEIEDYQDEENMWRYLYLMNYEEVAQELLDNDVFDNDYIRS
jgi:hypothetical protein